MIVATAVIRTYNSAANLPSCIASIRRQSVSTEIVVVDSGSLDGTVAMAKDLADTVLEISHESYMPGYALNFGIQAASNELVLLLSSHCSLARTDHIQIAARLHRAGCVATNGAYWDAGRSPIADQLVAHQWPDHRNPFWGMSNHASTISRSEWTRTPFRTDLIGCEDKAWAREVHRKGMTIAYSPELVVSSQHRRAAGPRNLYNRTRDEGLSIGLLLANESISPAAATYRQWRYVPPSPGFFGSFKTAARLARPARLIEAIGYYRGLSAAYSRRSDGPRN